MPIGKYNFLFTKYGIKWSKRDFCLLILSVQRVWTTPRRPGSTTVLHRMAGQNGG